MSATSSRLLDGGEQDHRFYIGDVPFKGEILKGEQPAIVDRDLFEAVQAKLSEQVNNHKAARTKSEALLVGRIFDDRGNRMTPSHVRKDGIKHRYYLSSTLLQGQAKQSGSVRRVAAVAIEAVVTRSIREHLQLSSSIDDRSLVNTHVVRVEVQEKQLVIQLDRPQSTQAPYVDDLMKVPWQKAPPTRRREILLPASVPSQHARQKPARPWSRRSHEGDAGLMNFSSMQTQVPKASPTESAAASGKST